MSTTCKIGKKPSEFKKKSSAMLFIHLWTFISQDGGPGRVDQSIKDSSKCVQDDTEGNSDSQRMVEDGSMKQGHKSNKV